MDWGSFFLLTIWFTVIMFLVQRAEAKRRRMVIYMLALGAFLTWYWANFRGLHTPFYLSVVAAFIINYLFWLFIGRYNPVGDSDDIQVIGMDD